MADEKIEQKTEITELPVKKVRGVPFKVGEDKRRNLNGKPKGTKSFNTIFEEAIREIVKSKKLPIKDPEKELMIKGITEALKGNHNFWRSLAEFRYGKPKESLDLSSGGEPLGIIILPLKRKQDENFVEGPAEARDSAGKIGR